ncbi:PREDICTED: protein RETICULATA-RELATED 3, chloroplastic-like [Tarenaya hassleriana]|uniref:protein RETICULATA-RELATED 3, chloroplastic-like n=1 Tax=Tarenaya hassleriana TaxID=28532 RepID=UPI00053C14AE|nr:PREDICTED: protein RETICULATA-RELATED 3, chloroplastic-like [Tarenaya hassleriana]
MAAMAQLLFSVNPKQSRVPLPRITRGECDPTLSITFPRNGSASSLHTKLSSSSSPSTLQLSFAGGDGTGGFSGNGGGNGGDGGKWDGHGDSDRDDSSSSSWGPLGLLIEGWRSRVSADPQFPFKVLMEELVGVTACVLGDMATRPNFGLNELDFVFCTLVVGSILNFALMYILAPTSASSLASNALPGIFATCPPSHMFEPGSYTVLNRFGTFVYKGVVFAAVGMAAGLVGTALSNGLIMMRKKMDPEFETPNKPPPTLLNASTWAAHMGLSSNLRYQTLNGVEFLLDKWMPPLVFKTSVFVMRCLNNVVGGMSFVVLARLTGSQSVDKGNETGTVAVTAEEEERLIHGRQDDK